jgi:hypothetical protein
MMVVFKTVSKTQYVTTVCVEACVNADEVLGEALEEI